MSRSETSDTKGKLHEKWRIVKLSSIFIEIDKKKRETRIENDKQYRLLTVKLYSKGIVSRGTVPGARIGVERLYLTKKGDFVLSKIDARNGAWGFVPDDLSGSLVSTDFPILRIANEIEFDKDFVNKLLSMRSFRDKLKAISSGTTGRRRVSIKNFLDLITVVPPYSEQKKIAYTLSKFQNAVETEEKELDLLNQLKKAVMHKLLTEGVGHTNFKETEIGTLPSEWELREISNLFEVHHGITLSPSRRGKQPNFPMLRTHNIQWGGIITNNLDQAWFSEREINLATPRFGDLFVCEGGDIGRTAMWEADIAPIGFQNHLHRLRKKNDGVCAKFYAFWMEFAILLKKLYVDQGNKTTIPNLSQSRLKALIVPYPSKREQEQISSILTEIDRRISLGSERKILFENSYRNMLQELMTGQIRVKSLVMS